MGRLSLLNSPCEDGRNSLSSRAPIATLAAQRVRHMSQANMSQAKSDGQGTTEGFPVIVDPNSEPRGRGGREHDDTTAARGAKDAV